MRKRPVQCDKTVLKEGESFACIILKVDGELLMNVKDISQEKPDSLEDLESMFEDQYGLTLLRVFPVIVTEKDVSQRRINPYDWLTYEDYREICIKLCERNCKEYTFRFDKRGHVNDCSETIAAVPQGDGLGFTLPVQVFFENVVSFADFVAYVKNCIRSMPQLDFEKLFSIGNLEAQLINTAKNAELLEKVPHKDDLDLSVILRFSDSEFSVIITNDLCELYDYSIEQLLEKALSKLKFSIMSLQQFLEERYKESFPFQDEMLLRIASTGAYGAIALVSDELKVYAKEHDTDLVLIPSSTQEILALKASKEDIDIDEIKALVKETNSLFVAEEIYLSDNVYYYDRLSDEMQII